MNWWETRQKHDPFVKKRDKNNLISRAYFKIEDIDKKYNLIKKNDKILDLGAAPGGWIQYFITKSNNITAIDLLPLKISHNINFIQDDIQNFNSEEQFDIIVSDIAHNLTGNKLVDTSKMIEIFDIIYSILIKNLKSNGNFVMKVFEGELITYIKKKLSLNKIKIFKPAASRKESHEIYIILTNFIK